MTELITTKLPFLDNANSALSYLSFGPSIFSTISFRHWSQLPTTEQNPILEVHCGMGRNNILLKLWGMFRIFLCPL